MLSYFLSPLPLFICQRLHLIQCLNASKSPLDTLLSHVNERTVSIDENTSMNLSGLSKHTQPIATPLRSSGENFSSSSRLPKSNYLTWTRSRAELRERARSEAHEHEENGNKRSWRWTFQRSDDRERLRHQPMTTKKWSGKKEHVCHSSMDFPFQKLCSMKNWIYKRLRA